MYAVSVSHTVVAQHSLTVPDAGPEGEPHSHTFGIEATFRGPELNEYGYLVDIDRVTGALAATVEQFRDELLNDLPQFEGLNPSAEHVARVVGDELLTRLDPSGASELSVRVTEDDVATVTHRRTL